MATEALISKLRMVFGKWWITIGTDEPIGPMTWAECEAYAKVLDAEGYQKEQ
jgi:hypothetical protein